MTGQGVTAGNRHKRGRVCKPATERRQQTRRSQHSWTEHNTRQAADAVGQNTTEGARRDGQARRLVARRDGQGVDQRGKARWAGRRSSQKSKARRRAKPARSGRRAEAGRIGRPHADATQRQRDDDQDEAQ